MSVWGEIKRRKVFQVGAAYAVLAWPIIQIANNFFPPLGLPAWSLTLVAVLILVGFPFALLLAWAYELTPDGVRRTRSLADDAQPAAKPSVTSYAVTLIRETLDWLDEYLGPPRALMSVSSLRQ